MLALTLAPSCTAEKCGVITGYSKQFGSNLVIRKIFLCTVCRQKSTSTMVCSLARPSGAVGSEGVERVRIDLTPPPPPIRLLLNFFADLRKGAEHLGG